MRYFIFFLMLLVAGCSPKKKELYINHWQFDSVLFNGQKMNTAGDFLQLQPNEKYVFYQFGQRDEGSYKVIADTLRLSSEVYSDRDALLFFISQNDSLRMQLRNTDLSNKMTFYLSAKK